ncbi:MULTISPECIES: sucrose phosphorylase [unclassified Colwellia]|uniref:sucrose phosphorylase n=1 Tax=unclassified Colwellia TaxID=196834 RepID=UPI0015F43461|nr:MULTISPECIES: sucrose phosphorylase [unclassified Colwellia]MBA6349711.1 sucrose phosphorylase [Colwellia sp. BRX8-9]MBA6380403.1 sucrose phosphorylase [Colwellia sp. BRX10-7]MBA6387801.1 sucrose phosphorylase [Colwellia sp. BRX10-2]MBA6402770.1 sucrose phosphorylase [Colwellia sp. BRX10-5]MBA6406855.1 sucrose phosphorylase [Colwellia sp. BRX10-1]
MKNNVQLITYIDRLTGADTQSLTNLLNEQLSDLFSGVHLLPFYYPIDGSDAGFDPIDHTQVDSRLGNWDDIKELGKNHELMADLIVNHMSAQSEEFKDVLKNGQKSPFWELFLTKDKVFPNGLNTTQQDKIYRPRPGSCFTHFSLPNNESADFWTTFTDNQIDIDVTSEIGKAYLKRILTTFSENNIKMIRLDAAGYALKKAGTSCFMLDETFEFIDELSSIANKLGIETLVEIHSYYQTQIEIAKRVDRVYDFALPPLVLHSLFSQNFTALAKWLDISPRNCITVLDTHDGIGIIDVGPMNGKAGLLDDVEIDNLVETIHFNSAGESKKATGAAASNVDIYQVNCTYYDALGQNDFDYLVARAIQFFSPGIPQVYYAGLLAEGNDITLLSKTNVGRDINRPYLNNERIEQALNKPYTKAIISLIKLRNNTEAFNGEFTVNSNVSTLEMKWQKDDDSTTLIVDLADRHAQIEIIENNSTRIISLNMLLNLS